MNPQGVLVMRSPSSSRLDGQIDSQGTIRGQLSGTGCVVTWVWRKLSGSTTAFDGEYVGVSRESSTTAGAPDAKCPPNGVPPTLTIANGIVTLGPWKGTVSPQGGVAINSASVPVPGSPRINAQIDGSGTIKGQGSNAAGCAIAFVWRKQSG